MRFGSLIPFLLLALALGAAAENEQCGWQANGTLCHDRLCCSRDGFCGSTTPYCDEGCQSQCHGNLSDLISWEQFNEILPHRNDDGCPANGFYTYDSLMIAAKSFQAFGMQGDLDSRKREIAAFLAQTSHETAGDEGPDAAGGPYTWGYCIVEEQTPHGNYCVDSQQWPCAPGKEYYGRGPIQISYNYNYGPAGEAIDYDLLSNPDAVAANAVVSFKTALWFWMTPQGSKPSCHDVINGEWQPTAEDEAAGRVPGYGLITNIINGEVECGNGTNPQMEYRIGFYKRYCDVLNVAYGDNLDCSNQKPFP